MKAWTRALAVLLTCASALGQAAQNAVPQQTGASEPIAPLAQAGAVPSEQLDHWRDLLMMDLPQELIARGAPLIAKGAALYGDGRAVALVARAQFESGQAEAASQTLDLVRPGVIEGARIELERVRQWLEQDRLESALKALGYAPAAGASTAKPRHAELDESWYLLGRALSHAGQESKAAPYLEEFVKRAPLHEWSARAWHLLAQEAFARGDLARGKNAMERGEEVARWWAFLRVRTLQVREKPSEPLPRMGLALVWMQAMQFERGRAVLLELTALAPDFAPGWFHLAECERKLAEGARRPNLKTGFQAAEMAYTRALELDPTLDLARYNRAVIYLLSGRSEMAQPELERLVSGISASDPKLLGAHLALARCLEAAGNSAAAKQRFARYVELGGKEPLKP